MCAWVIDDEISKSIGSRMKTTLAAAGLAHDLASSGTESCGPAVMSAMRESAFAKQAAAIEQQTCRFEAAVRQSDAGFWRVAWEKATTKETAKVAQVAISRKEVAEARIRSSRKVAVTAATVGRVVSSRSSRQIVAVGRRHRE